MPLIYLPIYKKIFVSGSESNILLNKTKKCIFTESTLFSKMFDLDLETKIFLYIGKWINGKFSISGQNLHFLLNKLDFWKSAYLVKNPHFGSVLAHILCVNYKKLLTKIFRSASQNYGARSSDRPKRKSASEPCGSIWVAENTNFGWNS